MNDNAPAPVTAKRFATGRETGSSVSPWQRERDKRKAARAAYLKSRVYLTKRLAEQRDEVARLLLRDAADTNRWERERYLPELERDILDLETRLTAYDAAHDPTCSGCGEQFHRGRADQRYCSGRCRVRAFRVMARARLRVPKLDLAVTP